MTRQRQEANPPVQPVLNLQKDLNPAADNLFLNLSFWCRRTDLIIKFSLSPHFSQVLYHVISVKKFIVPHMSPHESTYCQDKLNNYFLLVLLSSFHLNGHTVGSR